jgi:hypothetical protein
MAVIPSGEEVVALLRSQITDLNSLLRARRSIDRQRSTMMTQGQTAAAIQTAINALLTDWGALRDQVVTELTALSILSRPEVLIGMPALYTSAVIDSADSANPGGYATIRVNSTSETLVSPFSAFAANDVIEIVAAEDASNKTTAVVQFTPHATPRADLISNGSFGTDTLWTKGADWTIAAGVANAAAATSTTLKSTSGGGTAMPTAWTAGQYYLVTYTVTISAGSLKIGTNTTAAQSTATVAGANKTAIILADAHADGLVFTGNGFTGTLDNVSMIPWTGLALDRILGADNAADTSLKVVLAER